MRNLRQNGLLDKHEFDGDVVKVPSPVTNLGSVTGRTHPGFMDLQIVARSIKKRSIPGGAGLLSYNPEFVRPGVEVVSDLFRRQRVIVETQFVVGAGEWADATTCELEF